MYLNDPRSYLLNKLEYLVTATNIHVVPFPIDEHSLIKLTILGESNSPHSCYQCGGCYE